MSPSGGESARDTVSGLLRRTTSPQDPDKIDERGAKNTSRSSWPGLAGI
jgi:hypothetical protein